MILLVSVIQNRCASLIMPGPMEQKGFQLTVFFMWEFWEGLRDVGIGGLYNTSMVLAVRFSRNFLVCQDQSGLSQS